jgi:Xaa-Pro aminopeptidase
MDYGASYMGYCSDMTRTVAVGYATEEMKTVYNTVLQAQLAGLAVSKAGVIGAEIDAAARNVIKEAGYGDYFGHGYGHSLGLEIHEAPNPNPKNPNPMPLKAVASAEPGIYLPGKFGVRIEDTCVYLEDGIEILTASPKELIVIPV